MLTACTSKIIPHVPGQFGVKRLSRPEFTHAITLMPNRENISADLLRRIFGRFCMEVDQFMIGVGAVRNCYSSERLT